MNTATKEKFLEYMVQEPRLNVTPDDLNTLGKKRMDVKTTHKVSNKIN